MKFWYFFIFVFFFLVFFSFAPSVELLFSIRPPGGGRGDQGVAAAIYWITARELTLQRDTRGSETLCTSKVYHRKWGCLCVRESGVFPLLIPEVFSSRHFSSHCVFSTVVCFREWMCAHRRLFVCVFFLGHCVPPHVEGLRRRSCHRWPCDHVTTSGVRPRRPPPLRVCWRGF